MLSIAARAILKSLRLAPSTAKPTGTPAASVSTLRCTPSCPRSVGFLPVFFPPERRLGAAAVHAQPGPVDAHEEVVLQQAHLPELLEDAGPDPLLEAVVGGRAGDEAGGVQGLPLAAGAEHEENGVQAIAVGLAGPSAAELVGVGVVRQPGFELFPQFVGDPPSIGRLALHRVASCIAIGKQELYPKTGYSDSLLAVGDCGQGKVSNTDLGE